MGIPGLNFTNILQAAFLSTDPKSAKRLTAWQYFLHFWDLGKHDGEIPFKIAKGMEYLSGKRVVHGDLATRSLFQI